MLYLTSCKIAADFLNMPIEKTFDWKFIFNLFSVKGSIFPANLHKLTVI